MKVYQDLGARITSREGETLKTHPEVWDAMIATMRQHPAFTLVHGLFIPPDKQIARVRELRNERGWDFPDAYLAEAEKSIPTWPDDDRLVVVTLVPYLDDERNGRKGVERTFCELWAVTAKEQNGSWRWDGYDKAGPNRLQLLQGIEHRPGLRWEVIDLGCQRDRKPMDVRHPKKSPHAGILATAALHPEWVKAMDGENVPYVWIPGYEVNVSDGKPWRSVPHLHFSRVTREVRLYYYWYDYRHYSLWAVPSFRE